MARTIGLGSEPKITEIEKLKAENDSLKKELETLKNENGEPKKNLKP